MNKVIFENTHIAAQSKLSRYIRPVYAKASMSPMYKYIPHATVTLVIIDQEKYFFFAKHSFENAINNLLFLCLARETFQFEMNNCMNIGDVSIFKLDDCLMNYTHDLNFFNTDIQFYSDELAYMWLGFQAKHGAHSIPHSNGKIKELTQDKPNKRPMGTHVKFLDVPFLELEHKNEMIAFQYPYKEKVMFNGSEQNSGRIPRGLSGGPVMKFSAKSKMQDNILYVNIDEESVSIIGIGVECNKNNATAYDIDYLCREFRRLAPVFTWKPSRQI